MPGTCRRGFLRFAGVAVSGAALPALLPSTMPPAYAGPAPEGRGSAVAAETLLLQSGAVGDESYWQGVKAQFPIRDGLIPMNAANLAPAPRPVIEAVIDAMRSVEGDVSFQNRASYEALREQLRARLAAYLDVSPDELAIVRNASEANNAIAGGLPLGSDDEVVLHSENHVSNSIAWDVRAQRHGFRVRRVAVRPDMSHAEMLATFMAALSPSTRVLSFTDVSNVTGIRLPVRELCALGRSRGIHVHIDGAQSLGMLALNLRELGCDSYASSAHKWFLGPKEAGVLYVRSDVGSRIWPGIVSVGWGGDAQSAPIGARRFEALGQRNDATIAGLDAALTFQEQIGVERIAARILELAAALKQRLSEIPGAELVTPLDGARSGGVVVARFRGVDAGALHEQLYRDAGIASAPTGGLRLCPHICNTMDDVRYAADATARLVEALGERERVGSLARRPG